MPKPTTTNDNVDDLGYTTSEEVTPPAEEVTPPAATEDDKPVEKPASGYGKTDEVDAPAEEVAPPEEKTPEEISEEEKIQKEITESIKDLGDDYDKNKITKFAKDNKLTPDQLKAYVKFTKEEDAAAVKSNAEAIKVQRLAWKEELQNDKEFGGANFDKNVDRVEKLLQNNMSNTKKVLTEKGGVLPPYFMKDLLSLAKALNPTTNFVGGDAPAPKEEPKNFLDELYT